MINTIQINGEYVLDKPLSPDEEGVIIEEIIDQLKEEAKSIRFARIEGYRYTVKKWDGGGNILLAVDVEYSWLGRLLRKIGVIL